MPFLYQYIFFRESFTETCTCGRRVQCTRECNVAEISIYRIARVNLALKKSNCRVFLGNNTLCCILHESNNSASGHYLTASVVNGEYFLNDDSKRIKKVAKDYVEKNVVVIGKTLQKIKILFVVSAKAWLFRDWFVGLILIIQILYLKSP